MRIEENVDEKTTGAEEIAVGQKEGEAGEPLAKDGAQENAREKEAFTLMGKFKDVNALLKAYEHLQAEFTKRSQKLRSLEREMENFKAWQSPSGVEKLRKTARERREASKRFDDFVADVETPEKRAEKPISEDVREEEKACNEEAFLKKGRADLVEVEKAENRSSLSEESALAQEGEGERSEKGGEKFDLSQGESSEEKMPREGETLQRSGGGSIAFAKEGERVEWTSEELFQKALDSEEVRLKIVGEYLSSLGKAGVPLTGGGKGVMATPPKRATTVGQAGDMALLYFRKPSLD